MPLLLAVVLSACGDDSPGGSGRRPHVLVIVMDTTRADRCGINGDARSTTPALDLLAKDGVVFRNAWSPSSWTGPSHASLFTDLRPSRHGFLMGRRMYLDEGARTLAETLRNSGYRTACYSNNHIVSPAWGLTRGFEFYVPYYDKGPVTESRSLRTHRDAARWALNVHRRGERFFLFIDDIEPHLPYTPPAPFMGRFVPEGSERSLVDEARRFEKPNDVTGYCLQQFELAPEMLALLGHLYDAEIATLDASIGRLLDETLVVVTSDHGEALGEHHMLGHILSLDPWLLHVPLLVRLPGAFDGGRMVEDLVRLEDVMSTCLALCGLEIPDGLDARPLTRDLPGRLARAALGPPVTAELHHAIQRSSAPRFLCSMRSVQDGRYHFIRDSDGREELFDLSEDPGALEDLCAKRPEVVRRMRALLVGEW